MDIFVLAMKHSFVIIVPMYPKYVLKVGLIND